MTNVEISYNYGMSPSEAVMRGIDNIREVYGIRRLRIDEQARRVAVEYDATRLNPATVASLLRRTGLDLQ
jgi:copper chaperone CopZ